MNNITKNITKKRIGIYGGSFSPAHEGHLHISNLALSLLNLDEVWWLVANQNPLKIHNKGNVAFPYRFESAMKITESVPKIIVSDFEKSHGICKTIDTVELLFQEFADHDFVWLMGGDNFHIFHKWFSWQDILKKIPLAFFERSEYQHIEKAEVYDLMKPYQTHDPNELFKGNLPKWIYITGHTIDISSTEIRNKNPIWWENKH